MENVIRESDIVIKKYKNFPVDMFGPEMEAHLAIISRKLPSVAASLRSMRDSIASKRSSGPRPVYGEQTEISKNNFIDRGIPYGIRKILDIGPDNTEAIDLLGDALADKEAKIIFLHGPSGAGKSVAAAFYLNDKPGRFTTASHLAALSEKLQSDRQELYAFQQTKNLVIDDCGRGGETELDQRKIGDFLCLRADENLLTICTSITIPNYGESVKRRAITKFCSKKVEEKY